MHVGTLRLRRRWIDPDAVLRGQIFLTTLSALVLLMCGFALGWLASRWSWAGREDTIYGYGQHITTTTWSWVDNVDSGIGDGYDCDCNDKIKLALESLGNSSSMYYMYS